MPQIPGAWVYLWSKVCQQGSSCCVKLLVMSPRYFHIPNHQWVWIREVARSGGGSDTDMGVTDGVNVSRVCVCVYDTQTIVECKQSAAHIDSQDSQWDMRCVCTWGMLVRVLLCYLLIAPVTLLTQVKHTPNQSRYACHCARKSGRWWDYRRVCVCTCSHSAPPPCTLEIRWGLGFV